MSQIVQFPRKPRDASVVGATLPAIHHSVGVGTIVALLRASTPEKPDVEEKARIEAWLASDMLPGERADGLAGDLPEQSRG